METPDLLVIVNLDTHRAQFIANIVCGFDNDTSDDLSVMARSILLRHTQFLSLTSILKVALISVQVSLNEQILHLLQID